MMVELSASLLAGEVATVLKLYSQKYIVRAFHFVMAGI